MINTKSITLIAFFFVFLFLPANNYAQSYPVQTYTLENGLNTNFIHDVTQDQQGRMWFATEYGVSVYDGYIWKNYVAEEGLPRLEYFLIKADSNNNIIAVPYLSTNHIAIFKNNNWSSIYELPQFEGIQKNYTSFDILYENSEPVYYFGTNEGIHYYKNNKWYRITKKDGLLDNRINTLKSFQNKLYVCTEKGLSVIHEGKIDNSLNSLINVPSKQIKSIDFEKVKNNSDLNIWLLGNKWIGNIKNKKFNLVTSNNMMTTDFPSPKLRHICLIYDQVDRLYYGNDIEKFYYEISSKKVIAADQENRFTTSGSSAIFLDREANIWFTSYRGIDKVSNFSFQNYFKENGLLENEVTAICEVAPEYYIFGHNHGLTILKDDKFSTITLSTPNDKNYFTSRILDICKDSAGNVWIAASALGIGRMTNSKEIKWIKSGINAQITSVITDKHGTVWVGSENGLFKISEDNSRLILINNIEFSRTRKLFIDDNDVIYGACPDGLAIFKNGVYKKLAISEQQYGSSIFAVHKYVNDKKLIGTANGLYILENDTINYFPGNNPVTNRKIFFITKDKLNNYWFGTNDGVIKWDGNTTRLFSVKDGLSGRETNRSAYTLDSFGRIWIGTDHGLSCYLPQYDVPIKPPIITSIELEDAKGLISDLTKSFETSNGESSFIFRFRSISFINEELIQYRVRLDGFDNSWTELGTNRSIRYTNLKPGEYKLLVQAKNLGSDWSKTYESNFITILSPFYARWWFIVLTICIIGFILYMIHNYISEIKYAHKLEEEVLNRTAELKKSEAELLQLNATKDKYFSIVAHDLKSPFQGLLGISNILVENDGEFNKEEMKNISNDIYKTSKNLYTLIEQLLDWAQIQTNRMECNIEELELSSIINNILEMNTQNYEAKSIEIDNKVTDNIFVSADKRMLNSILSNLISNAVKFSHRNGKISISVERKVKFVEICIEDNGVGIEKEKIDKLFRIDQNISTKGTEGELGTGLGLILCHEMVDKLGGDIWVKSEKGKGTKFYFTLPVTKIFFSTQS